MKTLLDFKKYLQAEIKYSSSNDRINEFKNILLELYIFEDLNKKSQFVYIPDVNFKKWVLKNIPHSTNELEITVEEAAAFSGGIYVGSLNISDLTGIEAFTALTNLNCSNNLLTSLNVSANTALAFLNCSNNPLTSLNVSGATALTYLFCSYNLLTSLNVSANTALIRLDCSNNQLTSLNVRNGNNANFSGFYATSNPNLTCIQVDDVVWAIKNFKNIDKIVKFK